MVELTSVADDEVVLFDGSACLRHGELASDTAYVFGGVAVTTLPAPGELLCRFATANDVHFGETVCGLVAGTDMGPVFSVGSDDEPYPEVMNAAVVAEMAAIDPAVVVVKGDLTANGSAAEYERFLEVYHGAFGARLHHVRGNHDSYHGTAFADWATQEVAVPGVRLAIVDTARLAQVNGSFDAEQAEWLDELASRAGEPVLVFGHHHVWNPARHLRSDGYFGLRPDDSERLVEVFRRRPNLRGYFAGHTHRNHVERLEGLPGVPFAEVACVKDYPGAWAEYRVFDRGILQIMRRASSPEAVAWSEQTRHMYNDTYAEYAFGALEDRCFPITL